MEGTELPKDRPRRRSSTCDTLDAASCHENLLLKIFGNLCDHKQEFNSSLREVWSRRRSTSLLRRCSTLTISSGASADTRNDLTVEKFRRNKTFSYENVGPVSRGTWKLPRPAWPQFRLTFHQDREHGRTPSLLF